MKKNDKPKSSKDWLWTGILVVSLYLLSVGPACKLESKGLIPDSALEIVYAPLEVLGRSEAGGRVLHWYIFELWQDSVAID